MRSQEGARLFYTSSTYIAHLQDVQRIEAKLNQFKKDRPKSVPVDPKMAQHAKVWTYLTSSIDKTVAVVWWAVYKKSVLALPRTRLYIGF